MGHVIIVTHTDLDGTGSAAAYIRAAGLEKGEYTIIFAEPYNLDEVLASLEGNVERGDRVVIADLGPNKNNFEPIRNIVANFHSTGISIEWYDHHVWSREEAESLRAAGARVYIDTSTCATGVVATYASRLYRKDAGIDSFTEKLVSAVCAADLWRWDDPMAPKLFRVVGERSDDEWKMKLIEKFASGTLWDSELEERLEEYVNLELTGFDRVMRTVHVIGNGCRVAGAFKENGPPSNSFIGAMLLSRFHSDIAVILRPNGAVSLRSRDVDVQKVARALGGGGHPRASGAKIRIPLLWRIAGLLSKRILSRYAASLVYRTAVTLRICIP